jgi:starvation-inducible DNA-binding protein
MTKSHQTKKTEDVELENVPQTQLDNRMAKAKPTKLGWTTEEVENICTSLNQLLANYSVHYQMLRNYHWNVKGNDFFDLHEQFETQYTEALKNIDDIAERIRIFQETPLSTMKEYLDTSEIKETTPSLTADLMVREILSDYRILLEKMFSVVEIAVGQNDSGTEEMIKVFINNIEKHHWMMSAFLSK